MRRLCTHQRPSDVAADQVVIQAAAKVLDEVLGTFYPNFKLSVEAKNCILGIAWGESRFGSTVDWGTSNNWGAVTFHIKKYGYISHGDSYEGKATIYKFQAYPTQQDGCHGFLEVLFRGSVPVVLGGTSLPADLAAAMYANRYYTGIVGTTEQKVEAYAGLILRGSRYVLRMLAAGEGPDLYTVLGYQTALHRLGIDCGPLDGRDGPKTRAGVRTFQSEHPALVVDGIFGPRTRAQLSLWLATLA